MDTSYTDETGTIWVFRTGDDDSLNIYILMESVGEGYMYNTPKDGTLQECIGHLTRCRDAELAEDN